MEGIDLRKILSFVKNVERPPIQTESSDITGGCVIVVAINRILTSEVRRLLSLGLRKKTTVVRIVHASLNSHILAAQQIHLTLSLKPRLRLQRRVMKRHGQK